MKRRIAVLVLAALLLAVLAAGAAVAAPGGPAGQSKTAHLYLYEKNPADWSIVDHGAWGKMKYRTAAKAFDFVFNGHRLEPGAAYTLIYYPDPWPGNGLICLGAGVVNEWGDIHITEGDAVVPDLPIAGDTNAGAKIWLVLSADVDCSGSLGPPAVLPHMIGWNPTEYLFEKNLIAFDNLNLP